MKAPTSDNTTKASTLPRARVPLSVARLLIVAGNTFLEAVRQKLFNFLLLLAIGLVASAQFFQDFNFGASELKFISDFGFGAMVFFGSTLTIAATAQLFFSEIENRTALTILAKPIWRTEFIFGKFLGVFAVVGVFCAITTLLMAGLLWHRENTLMHQMHEAFPHGRIIDYGALLIVGALQWLKFGVLAMITLLIASFSNTNLYTVVTGFFVLVICHLQYLAQESYAHVASLPLRLLVQLLGYVFPNFQLFNLTDQIGEGGAPAPGLVLHVGGYALIYIAVFGALSVYSFRNREI